MQGDGQEPGAERREQRAAVAQERAVDHGEDEGDERAPPPRSTRVDCAARAKLAPASTAEPAPGRSTMPMQAEQRAARASPSLSRFRW